MWSRFLFVVLVLATFFNVWMALRQNQQSYEDKALFQRVDAFLTVWAVNWGADPSVLKPLLMDVLKRFPNRRGFLWFPERRERPR